MQPQFTTDSMEILNVLIYEQELQVSKNEYNPKKMLKMVTDIGGPSAALELFEYPYNQLFSVLIGNNYKIPKDTWINTDSNSWSNDAFTRAIKKVQKQLELELCVRSDDSKQSHVINPSNEIRKEIARKVAIKNNVDGYNKEIPTVTKHFKQLFNDSYKFEFYKDLKWDVIKKDNVPCIACNAKDDILRYFSSNPYMKDYLSKTAMIISDAADKSGKTEDEKLDAIKKIISERLYHIKKKTRKSVEDEITVSGTINYYTNMIKELNETYGYAKYELVIDKDVLDVA